MAHASTTSATGVPFKPGDYVMVGSGDTGATGGELLIVASVSGTTMTLKAPDGWEETPPQVGFKRAHAVGDPIYAVPSDYQAANTIFLLGETYNAIGRQGMGAAAQGYFEHGLRSIISRLRLAEIFESDHTAIKFTGTWNGPTPSPGVSSGGPTHGARVGGGLRASTVANSTVEFHISDNFQGGNAQMTFIKSGPGAVNNVFTFTVDGVAAGSISTNGMPVHSGRNKPHPITIRFKNLAPGRHKIVATNANLDANLYFDYAGIEALNPPVVVCHQPHRFWSYDFFAAWTYGHIRPTLTANVNPQFLRPIDDLLTGGWTATPLWSKVDEPDPADDATTQITSNVVTTNIATGLIDLDLGGSITDPGGTQGFIIRVRAKATVTGSAAGILNMDLWQGGTSRKLTSTGNLTTSYAEYIFTLTAAEVAAIRGGAGGFDDLHIRFTGARNAGLAAVDQFSVQITQVELEIPAVTGSAGSGTSVQVSQSPLAASRQITAGSIPAVGETITINPGTAYEETRTITSVVAATAPETGFVINFSGGALTYAHPYGTRTEMGIKDSDWPTVRAWIQGVINEFDDYVISWNPEAIVNPNGVKSKYTFRQDDWVHWTDYGHALMAESIYDLLQQEVRIDKRLISRTGRVVYPRHGRVEFINANAGAAFPGYLAAGANMTNGIRDADLTGGVEFRITAVVTTLSTGLARIRMKYSLDGGTTWFFLGKKLSANAPADQYGGMFTDWLEPGATDNTAQILCDATGGAINVGRASLWVPIDTFALGPVQIVPHIIGGTAAPQLSALALEWR
jgi:hypothetical protein